MYNLNFDIWKFGHPQCANSANGALSKLDIQNNDIDEERKAEIQQTCDLKSITCLL